MRLLTLLLPVIVAACATASPPPAPPAPSPAPAPGPSAASSVSVYLPPVESTVDPFFVPGDLRSEEAAAAETGDFKLPKASGAEAKTPAMCQVHAKARPKKAPACGDPRAALESLAAAIALDGESRDGALLGLESCAGLPGPLVRAIRASYAPVSCAEAIVGPLLARDKPDNAELKPYRSLLQGQALAARIHLGQAARPMPTLAAPVTRESIRQFVGVKLPPWIKFHTAELAKIEELVARLPRDSYGLALATSELGLAYHEFMRSFRAAPVPAELKTDDELRTVYYTAIDEATGPAKQKALQILAEAGAMWARQGVLHERSADAARAALGRSARAQVGWQSGVLLPAAPAPGDSIEQQLAARLPVFATAQFLFLDRAPGALGALLKTGYPLTLRSRLDAGVLGPDERLRAARLHAEIGLHWREGVHFDRALALLGGIPPGARSPEAAFWMALALTYRKAVSSLPADLAARSLPPAVVPTEALESIAIARPPGPFAPHALVTLVATLDLFPPPGALPPLAFQRGQLARLEAARPLLTEEAPRKEVDQLLQDRREIIRFLESR